MQAFNTALEGLWERVAELICQANTLEVVCENSRVSFDTMLNNTHQEIQRYVCRASKHHCKEYKCKIYDQIAGDHTFMDVMPFVSVVIHNICTLKVLLASHQVEWSTVPLQIMMAPMFMDVVAVPSHLEFVQYFTQWSLHV